MTYTEAALRMNQKYQLGITDYIVVLISLAVAVAIGIKFGKIRQKDTSTNYLMANRSMPMFPVVMSIVMTMMSGITLLGHPAEVYKYGFQMGTVHLFTAIGMLLARVVFLPVYFQCEVTTTYEFLQLRYGTSIQRLMSALFLLQMILYMSIVLYAPVLALNAVTNLSVELSIIVIGLVCTVYCVLGGLKAIFWTDALQAFLMFACIIAMAAQGIYEAGGFSEVFRISKEGGRLDIFNIGIGLESRYSIWNVIVRGLTYGVACYGTSQVEVQRMMSLSSLKRSQASLAWAIFPNLLASFSCVFMGLVLYAIFHACDPISSGDVSKFDQMVPFFIVSRFSYIPGLTGLCVAGIFSGSLSTISSALNSISTVTIVDFIKPIFSPNKLSDQVVVYIAKGLSLFYGVICIGLAFALTKYDGLNPISNTMYSIMEGPMFAVFFVAILTRKASEKCAVIGLILGVMLTGWIGFGSVFSGYRHPALPINTEGCSAEQNSSRTYESVTTCINDCSSTVFPSAIPPRNDDVFPLYKISFMWLTFIGFVSTLAFILLAALFTGWKDVVPFDSKYLSPVTKLWSKAKHSNVKKDKDLQMTKM